MNKLRVDKAEISGEEYTFVVDFNFTQVESLKEQYKRPTTFNKPNWWYRKNDFADWFLKQIGTLLPLDFDVPENEWYKIIPILKHYFLTITEFKNICQNCVFLAGGDIDVREDKWFTMYMLLKKFGSLSEKDIKEMNYKTANVMFIYSITEYVIERNKRKGRPPEMTI